MKLSLISPLYLFILRDITLFIPVSKHVRSHCEITMAKRQSFTVSEVIDELFMDYDSEHEPDEADDDSDPDFQADSDANNETGLCTIYSRVFTQNFIMIHSQLSILQRLF